MRVEWFNEAIRYLDRVRRFLLGVNARAANHAVASLRLAPRKLLEHPRMGVRLDEFGDREIRRISVGPYELRYEIVETAIYIVRIWYGREER